MDWFVLFVAPTNENSIKTRKKAVGQIWWKAQVHRRDTSK